MSIGAFGVSFGIRLALFLNSFSLLRTLYRFTQMRRVRDAFRIGLLRYPPTECGGIIASGDPAQFRVICLVEADGCALKKTLVYSSRNRAAVL